ncbi:fimbrial protein [Serratia aquatilis]|uniref:Fimbrial protein n=1 Tax=Serratia aquatilis TaxID=1737515 RepID=A0ABV6EA63_9GAMM
MRIFYLWLNLSLFSILLPGFAEAVDLRISGDLVAEPCVVNIDSIERQVKFNSIPSRNFYLHPRSAPESFVIMLEQCDVDIAKSVSISFTGEDDSEQPGLLAVTGDAKGIAIVLETEQGEPLAINRGKAKFTLRKGITYLEIKAYLQASKKSIENRGVKEGEFSATAIFNLEYE